MNLVPYTQLPNIVKSIAIVYVVSSYNSSESIDISSEFIIVKSVAATLVSPMTATAASF